jgi:NADH-quinone oxidoreductase subunit F
MSGRKLLMTFPVTETSHALADYKARGGYSTIEKVIRTMLPSDVTKEVTASGIQGRGGAAFPAGRKWAVINLADGQPHYLCANADEGEPGTFKDRWILENAPHLLVESMLIAAYALEVRHAFVYIRGEFDLPYRRLAGAIEEARAAGYLGAPLFGSEFACNLVAHRGAGSYVCGEASGLLTSLEGKRGYPRNRPPRLTVKGLYQRPTVVNNVETPRPSSRTAPRRIPGPASSRSRGISPSPACTRSRSATRGASSSRRTAAG